jgi:hypothetical protein
LAAAVVGALAVADGFLGRWSQRKQAARTGQPLVEPPPKPLMPPASPAAVPAPLQAAVAADEPQPFTPPATPLPTLAEAESLTSGSDFKPFVARGVTPEVRNAAMKKLFADPQFNVMDGLDIYIDDYSKPDPLPLSLLRQMASAKFLNLFEDEEVKTPPASDTPPTEPSPDHDHTDLRLQPNHAAGPQAPGRGTE